MQEGLIVLNKYAGWSCFPYRKDPTRPSMLQFLLERYPEQNTVDWPEGFEGGIAHRLDVSTSGQLLVATNVDVLARLRDDFAAKRLVKKYCFLTRKQVPWTEHTLEMAIAHHPTNRKKMVVQRGRNTPHRGKWYPASTHFRYVGPYGSLYLWEATMKTGVTHQIRLHASMVGLVLAGDRLYGGGETPKGFPATFALHHVGLHGSEWNPTAIPPNFDHTL